MARKAREKSSTGIYHIMLRGTEVLFDTKESYAVFLAFLEQYTNEYNARLYAYSILSDRIHIVIGEENVSISQLVKSVSIRYARYFNGKRKTGGRLFYGRFQSEPIETQEDLAACVDFVNRLADIFMETETALTSLDQYNGGRGICTSLVETSGGDRLSKLFMEEYRFMNIAYIGRFIKARCGHGRGEAIPPNLKKSILDIFLEEKRVSRRAVCEFFGWNGMGGSDDTKNAERFWSGGDGE